MSVVSGRRKVLSAGSSKPWPDVLQEALGTNKMDAGPLMSYFEPITRWLQAQNRDEILGWPDFDWRPPMPENYPEDVGRKSTYTTYIHDLLIAQRHAHANSISGSACAINLKSYGDWSKKPKIIAVLSFPCSPSWAIGISHYVSPVCLPTVCTLNDENSFSSSCSPGSLGQN